MSKQKPAWRMNSGNGVPSDWNPTDAVMYFNGAVQEGYSHYTWSLDDNFCAPIAAYQTNRTKAAKYERKICSVCEGKGKRNLTDWVTKNPFTGVCIYCHGKGYKMERVK